jgi:SAM-dependent methyltransferase
VFTRRYFVGNGIDVGGGDDGLGKQQWPRMEHCCRTWDLSDGDAQLLSTVDDDTFDFLHSSHCLEHMRDPYEALKHWVRVVKPGGHLVVMVPDEDMYEQGVFPSTFNGDHKSTFTIYKARSWSPVSVSIVALLLSLGDSVETLAVQQLRDDYDWTKSREDQTGGPAACAIEFILRKRMPRELLFGGRVGAAR